MIAIASSIDLPGLLTATTGWLLTYLLHSTALVLGVYLACRLIPQLGNHMGNLLWKMALCGGLITASFQAAAAHKPVLGVYEIASPQPTVTQAQAQPPAALPEQAMGERHQLTRDGRTVVVDVTRPGAAPAVAAAPVSPVPQDMSPPLWPSVLALLWVVGAGVAVARQGMAARRFSTQVKERSEVLEDPILEGFLGLCQRAGIRRKVRLTASANITSPVALGRSEICLPQRAVDVLAPAQIQAILAHELAHLERRDTVWFVVASAIESIFFFQPLNSLARRRMQVSAEYLCDDWAAHHTGTGEHLAKSLAEVATWTEATPQPAVLPGIVDGQSPLVDRISRLIDNKQDALRIEPTPWRVSAVLAPVALVALVAPRIAAAEDRAPQRIEPVPAVIPVAPVAPEEEPAIEAYARAEHDGERVVVTLRDGTEVRLRVDDPPPPPPVIHNPEPIAPPPPPPPAIHFRAHAFPHLLFHDDPWLELFLGGTMMLIEGELEDAAAELERELKLEELRALERERRHLERAHAKAERERERIEREQARERRRHIFFRL
ncbi:MAG: M56 family metallopeptidase [Myxococcales bacterium]|nr:M56 family metallopeptidase [Myxococcales bacterium]